MSDAPNAEVLAAVRKRAEAWGTKLIDLNPSKNSLLLFRPGRGTQIDLTDCDAEALRRLRDGDRVRLSHILPEDDLRSRVLKQLSSLRRKVAQLEEEQGFDPLRIAFGLEMYLLHAGSVISCGKFNTRSAGDVDIRTLLVHRASHAIGGLRCNEIHRIWQRGERTGVAEFVRGAIDHLRAPGLHRQRD